VRTDSAAIKTHKQPSVLITTVDDGTDWTGFTQDSLGSVCGLVDDATMLITIIHLTPDTSIVQPVYFS
jgi:hypothetical protein